MSETRIIKSQSPSIEANTGVVAVLRSIVLPLLLLTGAFVLWVISLPMVNPNLMNDLGLVSVLPVTFFAALAVLAISYLMALNQPHSHDFILLLHILVLIFILHGTPQIVYGTLRYSWAWKHVGIVDYIQRNGSVDPSISNLNAYHNWPGFFAMVAMYNVVAGLQSSLSYAGWGPVFFNLLDLGALLMIFRTFTNDRRLMWLSVWFFYLFSWVGQDYFSPQAISYFLYLVAMAIVFKWFRDRKINHQASPKPSSHFRWLSNLYHTIINRDILDDQQSIQTNPRQRMFIMSALILIFFAIASSHQLTPLMVISALTLLVLFQVTNQRYIPLLIATITAIWIFFMAVGFLNGNLYWIIQSIGSLLDNVNRGLVNLAVASPGQQLVALVDRAMSALVWVVAFFGLYRRYRSGRWDLPAVLLAIAPIPMLALNSYGGEMIFRVYMFSLPFVIFLTAALFYPSLKAGTSFKTPLLTTIFSLMVIPGFLFSYYGKERMSYFSPNEVAAAQILYNTAPKGSLIVDGIWDWPRQYINYEYYNYQSLLLLTPDVRLKVLQNPVQMLSQFMDDAAPGSAYVNPVPPGAQSESEPNPPGAKTLYEYPAAYVVITRSQIAESEMTGTLPADWSGIIIKALSQSNKFQVVFSNSDAIIFKYIDINGG